jgi:import inner membrane translocase subunit TIM50
MTPPHTLVLDLENTLVHSTWDRKHGWRHAKRPGVDKFLTDMAQYYEIVLYSPSHEGLADPVVASLDKNGCIMHRLYRDACYYKNGSYTKDLSSLNRNMNKIILIDDDESAARSHKENWIPIRPYDNPNDRTDSTLSRITPFLIEVAREGYNDIPGLLRQFRGMDAVGIADEMERRVREMRDLREKRSLHGLGALAHVGRGGFPPPEMTPVDASSVSSSVKQLTSKDLVAGAVTGTSSDSGGFKGWLNKRQKEKEEQHMRTMEHWNEIMMKKSMEKKQREASTTV